MDSSNSEDLDCFDDLDINQLIGKIVFISGPMFAGKSDKILNLAELFDSVEAFKPACHIRDGETISSRTGKEISCQLVQDIRESIKSNKQAIIIDESQFIECNQLIETLEFFKKEKRTLIIAGLRKKNKLEYWPNYKILKEKCDILIKLKARCEVCGKPAKYIHTNLEGMPRAIARKEKFGTIREPRCKNCYDLVL